MTKDDVIRMEREAGIKNDCDGVWCTADQLERFVALVAAANRDACLNAVQIALLGADSRLTECVVASIKIAMLMEDDGKPVCWEWK